MTSVTVPQQQDARRVLTRAVLKAADLMAISQTTLSAIIGVSPATISRLRKGAVTLNPNDKSWELALLFVRLFRGLDALMGSDDQANRQWLNADNHWLNGKPIDRIQTVTGLTQVVAHVDAFRARI